MSVESEGHYNFTINLLNLFIFYCTINIYQLGFQFYLNHVSMRFLLHPPKKCSQFHSIGRISVWTPLIPSIHIARLHVTLTPLTKLSKLWKAIGIESLRDWLRSMRRLPWRGYNEVCWCWHGTNCQQRDWQRLRWERRSSWLPSSTFCSLSLCLCLVPSDLPLPIDASAYRCLCLSIPLCVSLALS